MPNIKSIIDRKESARRRVNNSINTRIDSEKYIDFRGIPHEISFNNDNRFSFSITLKADDINALRRDIDEIINDHIKKMYLGTTDIKMKTDRLVLSAYDNDIIRKIITLLNEKVISNAERRFKENKVYIKRNQVIFFGESYKFKAVHVGSTNYYKVSLAIPEGIKNINKVADDFYQQSSVTSVMEIKDGFITLFFKIDTDIKYINADIKILEGIIKGSIQSNSSQSSISNRRNNSSQSNSIRNSRVYFNGGSKKNYIKKTKTKKVKKNI